MSGRFLDLSQYSAEPERYAPADNMRAVMVVDEYRVRYAQIRDGVGLSQTVLHDAMSATNWDRHAYAVKGGNGWVTAVSEGRNIMSAHVTSGLDDADHFTTAPAYGLGG